MEGIAQQQVHERTAEYSRYNSASRPHPGHLVRTASAAVISPRGVVFVSPLRFVSALTDAIEINCCYEKQSMVTDV